MRRDGRWQLTSNPDTFLSVHQKGANPTDDGIMNAQNLQLVQQSPVIDEIESLTEINKKDLGVHALPVERFEEDVHEIHQCVSSRLTSNRKLLIVQLILNLGVQVRTSRYKLVHGNNLWKGVERPALNNERYLDSQNLLLNDTGTVRL